MAGELKNSEDYLYMVSYMWLDFKKIGFLIVILLLTACASTAEKIQLSANDQKISEVKSFYFTGGLVVDQVQGEYQNGLYRGRILLRNTRTQELRLQYQFTWYDKKGKALDFDDSAWTPITLYGKGEKIVAAIAPTAEVAGFKVGVRDLAATKVFKTNFLGKY